MTTLAPLGRGLRFGRGRTPSSRAPGHRTGVFAALVFLGLGAGTAAAASLFVATNGTDSATCGVKTPCRSVSQAIANAKARDQIVVGPGRYGDLNGNGTLGEVGEETGGNCICMILVNKPLTLQSTAGAGATILDASTLSGLSVVEVGPGGSGSTIGNPGKGFTFRGGFSGLLTPNGPFVTDLTIGGNIAINSTENGFLLHADSGGFTLTDNLAIHNGTGGFYTPGGVGHTFRGNAAIFNASQGFGSDGGAGHTFIGNIAIGNGLDGFNAIGGITGLVYQGNSAIGNMRNGWGFRDNATATLTQNNIYGNDPTFNCGILAGGVVNATNNFFGASTGPGFDPADDVCVFSGGSVVFTPFAAKEFPVSSTWK
jgi:hypothetical protein